MGQPVAVAGRAEAAEFRQELLARLGLGADASDQDVEGAYNALAEFLELAPHGGVRSWAAARTVDLDEAFALLSGPAEDLNAAAPAAAAAAGVQNEVRQAPEAPISYGAPTPSAPRAGQPVWAIVLLVVAGIVVLGAVIFGVYRLGSGSDLPAMSDTPTNGQTTAPPGAGAPAPVPLDKAKVAALTKKVTANPKDVTSLQGLGDAYFAASDYKNAAVWEAKILAVDPKNQVALLALGAANFNQGNAAEAKKHWLVAAKIYPNNAEVHYDLGFLYLSQTPPDKVKMTEEWNKVIAIDPESAIAKTVATHLKPSPTPSGHPTTK